jgi:hypothetical protein
MDLINPPDGEHGLPSFVAIDAKLPTQPQELIRVLQRQIVKGLVASKNPSSPTAVDEVMYSQICNGLLYSATSPALRAALYQVLAKLPGVRLLGSRTDAIGRKGIAIAMLTANIKNAEQITLIDPSTGEQLETENVHPNPLHTASGTLPAGTPMNYMLFLQRGIVNSLKDLPGGGQVPGPDTPTITYVKPRR